MTFDSLQATTLATRRLRNAIVASLLAHLLVLGPVGMRLLTNDSPALLQATLRAPPPAEPAPPAQQRAVPPAPTFAQPRSRSAAPEIGDRPQLHESRNRGLSPISKTPLAPSETVATPPSGSESAVVVAEAIAAPTGVAGSVGGSLVTDANASGEAVDGLRGYRLAVATQARRFKRYPAQAMASGWAGSADIRVEVGSDGRPHAATLARSSGYEVLDRAALTMIDAGALRARLPESLRGKAFAVVLPVVFNLDDE